MKIHPTAVVDSSAIIGKDCEIGPFTIIGPGVVLGERCIVQGHCFLTGDTHLGTENFVGFGSVIGTEPQDFAFDPAASSGVRIGSRNRLREYVTIHRGTKPGTMTEVGDDNFLMTGTHLGHNCKVGNRVIIANNCLLAGYVEIMDGAVLGGGSAFHQFLRVGPLCMTRGGTRYGKDLPPFTVCDDRHVIGLNAIGMRRAGISAADRKQVRDAFNWIYRSGRNLSQALDEIPEREWNSHALKFFDFCRSSRRGISRLAARNLLEDAAGEE